MVRDLLNFLLLFSGSMDTPGTPHYPRPQTTFELEGSLCDQPPRVACPIPGIGREWHTIRRCGLVEAGVAWLEEMCHCVDGF